MKIKPQFIKLLMIFLAVTFLSAACGAPSGTGQNTGKQITLTWWKPFDDPRLVQPLVQEFQKSHPNVRVEYVEKNIETYEDELIDALAAGKGPDIFSIHNDWLPKHKDKITPAGSSFWTQREFADQFIEAAQFDLVADDKIHGVPLSIDTLAMYYNKDMLSSAGIARPPATWAELVEMTPKLTRQGAAGRFERHAAALGTSDNVNRAADILSLLMLQNGTSFYTADKTQVALTQTLRDPSGNPYNPAATALEFYTQFANPAKVTYTWNAQSSNSIDAFVSSQAAMIFSYSYLRNELFEKAPFLNYGIAAVPQIDPARVRINFANYWAESVSKQSANPDEAWQFLKFISQKDVLKKSYEAQKRASSRLDILEEQIRDAEIGVFAESALSAKGFHKPNAQGVENIMLQMIGDVILRNISPQEAVNTASQKLQLLLRNF